MDFTRPLTDSWYILDVANGTDNYYGYMNKNGEWYVMKNIGATNTLFKYSAGNKGGYTTGTGFAAWAGALTYTTPDVAFSGR